MTISQLPLNALRAFEAAARHLSFSKAAGELHVTPAAISHQIKGLEERWGLSLFIRNNRNLTLSEQGRLILPEVSEGFAVLDRAVKRLTAAKNPRALTVSSAPSVAAKWLLPRLHRFQDAQPDIDIHIQASNQVADFAVDDVDVALRYGRGPYPGLHVDVLLESDLYPVCSPALLAGDHPLQAPSDLKHHLLLHDDSWHWDGPTHDWEMWLRAAGVTDVDPRRGPHFDSASLALEAAAMGRGVVLSTNSTAGGDIQAGRLVRPFDLGLPLDFKVHFVCPPGALERPNIRAFRDWVVAEAAATV
jgi:LysR family transcriptional regulator, glycine cleavage system transcriptional activator